MCDAEWHVRVYSCLSRESTRRGRRRCVHRISVASFIVRLLKLFQWHQLVDRDENKENTIDNSKRSLRNFFLLVCVRFEHRYSEAREQQAESSLSNDEGKEMHKENDPQSNREGNATVIVVRLFFSESVAESFRCTKVKKDT